MSQYTDWIKGPWHCPNCGHAPTLKAQGSEDFYAGSMYLCLACPDGPTAFYIAGCDKPSPVADLVSARAAWSSLLASMPGAGE